MENIRHPQRPPIGLEYHLEGIEKTGKSLAELVDDADVIVHLAAAVGVKIDRGKVRFRTIETNVNGTQDDSGSGLQKRKQSSFLIASTSEVYGKKHQRAVSRRCGPGARRHYKGTLELCARFQRPWTNFSRSLIGK